MEKTRGKIFEVKTSDKLCNDIINILNLYFGFYCFIVIDRITHMLYTLLQIHVKDYYFDQSKRLLLVTLILLFSESALAVKYERFFT